jgi:hypothetical protein
VKQQAAALFSAQAAVHTSHVGTGALKQAAVEHLLLPHVCLAGLFLRWLSFCCR